MFDVDATIEAYRSAANALFAVASHASVRDFTAFFPITTLWKEYVRLSLRRVIALGCQLLDEPSGFPSETRIDDLWIQARRHIATLDRPSHEMARIEDSLRMLCADEWADAVVEPSSELTLSMLQAQMEELASALAEVTMELEGRAAVRHWGDA